MVASHQEPLQINVSLYFRHRNVSDDDFLQLAKLQHLETLEVLDAFYAPDPRHMTRIIYQASPHLLQLISDLKKLTDHRVQVITNSSRCILTCTCVWPIREEAPQLTIIYIGIKLKRKKKKKCTGGIYRSHQSCIKLTFEFISFYELV